MIRSENIIIDEREFIRTYSDKGVMIHGGMPEVDYAEAIDPADLGRTYTETDIPIDGEASAEEIINILTGEEQP